VKDFSVSVIIPVYNAATYVERAVQSVIEIPEAGEVLLVDDGSADNSLEVCFELQKKYHKVKVLQHPGKKNQGAAASRNLGIVNASCEFVAFLDADDYYLPHRFKRGKQIFTENPEVDGVFGCCVNEFENEKAKELFFKTRSKEVMTFNEEIPSHKLYKYLLYGSDQEFHTSAITIRKSAFKKTGLFNEKIRYVEDTELWVKLALKVKLLPGSIKEPVSVRIVHENNSIHELEKIKPYRNQMFRELFDWAMGESFSFEIRNNFFIVLHIYIAGASYSVKKLFWEQVIRNPAMIFTTYFPKKIHQLYFVRK
jgi:glycosyltransferase involved in cell wall biosynthesis